MLLLSSLIKKIYLKSGLCFQNEKSNMTANLLRKWQDILKSLQNAVYFQCTDVLMFIITRSSWNAFGIKMFENVANALKNVGKSL